MPSYVTSTAVSPSGTYMAFGDAEGAISLLTAADEEAATGVEDAAAGADDAEMKVGVGIGADPIPEG